MAASAGKGDEPKDVTADESKQLRRVYDYLCDFAAKSKLEKQRQPLLERKSKILAYKKNPEAVKIVDADGHELSQEQVDRELDRIDAECTIITARIEDIERKADKKVKVLDLQEALAKLGKKATKKEIEDMVWEVDENLDGAVDWEEFQLMFERNVKDTTGLEPYRLFNVVQFMMYDKDGGGEVSVDETMHMLYSRYGRDRLEEEMRALFGDRIRHTGDATLTFTEYLAAVERRIPKRIPPAAATGGASGTAAAAATGLGKTAAPKSPTK
jgi:calmodulin